MEGSQDSDYDYIIVGGGIAGCTLASRLQEILGKSSSILLLEAGPDPSSNPNTKTPMEGFALAGSELDWAYKTAPIPTLADRVFTLTSGKTLGGGSVLNYGGWLRGDAKDFDAWAEITNDEHWSYRSLLPYLKRSEHFTAKEPNPDQQGLDGPMKITSVSESDPKRQYPMRESIEKAWAELGVKRVPSGVGKLAGLTEFLENWDSGIRQPAHLVYDLTGVEVRTNTPVDRVLFETLPGQPPRAESVLLADGSQIKARKEIVLATGALRTPQILQISGVGPAELLASYDIPLICDSPDVGTNLAEHFALYQVFKLRNPERGLSLGHPKLTDPAFFKGFPVDWAINEALPANVLHRALAEDGESLATWGLSNGGKIQVETLIVYHPLAPGVPVDGSYIGTSVMLTLPTSRGTVRLASTSSNDSPLIESNYFATAVDQAALVYGVQRLLRCLTNTVAGQDVVEAEVPPAPGMKALTLESTKEEIVERIRQVGYPHFHASGTCALGSVLDAELRVKGVEGLRVVDTSVFPAPLSGHPQAALYGVAEMAAVMIAGKSDA